MSELNERDAVKGAAVAQALLAWYRVHQRSLPWRQTPTPYRVWISEIMLQQTQVATVIPYFERWMARFPDVRALASAPTEDVLALWSGLGYYRRAHLLHKAARQLVAHHDGQLPTSVEGLLTLSGVGRYTAGAIASIAFNQQAPIVDGNVIRVLCRIFGIDGDPRGGPNQKRLWALAEALIPQGQARDFNQSMMELGALVCAPRNPRCQTCPAASWCVALTEDRVAQLPQPPKRKKRRRMVLAVALLRDPQSERYLLLQRPDEGLFAGLWELPSSELAALPRVTDGDAPYREALASKLEAMAVSATIGASLGRHEHVLTHIKMIVHPMVATLDASAPPLGPAARWVSPEALSSMPLSALTRGLVERHIVASEPNARLF